MNPESTERLVQEHLETFLSLADDPTGNGLPGYVEQEFCKYLQCGIPDNQ